jgi:hypothetical protein
MVKISVFPQGTRIRVKRGRFPMAPELIGREGLVIRHNRIVRDQVGVQLDGEEQIRTFTDQELEPLSRELSVGDTGSPGPGLSPTGG